MKRILVVASVAVLLLGCSLYSRHVQLTVVNESAATLTNIFAIGSGFSVSVGSLAPGAKQQVPLKSNTGPFKLEFDASGKHFSEASPKNPWDGMKELIMTVTTNFRIDCASVTTF